MQMKGRGDEPEPLPQPTAPPLPQNAVRGEVSRTADGKIVVRRPAAPASPKKGAAE